MQMKAFTIEPNFGVTSFYLTLFKENSKRGSNVPEIPTSNSFSSDGRLEIKNDLLNKCTEMAYIRNDCKTGRSRIL